MQVNRINHNIPNRIAKQNNGRQNSNINNNTTTPSFKGAGLDKFALLVADAIENGGLFVSFTLQDMIGTNLPRPISGLFRNKKENNGEANKSFAFKELVREMLSGPSMFAVPWAMLTVGKPIFGKSINVPMDFIKSFGEIHAENAVNEAGKAISQQEFCKNAFAEMIKNAKSETTASESTIKTAAEFAERLFSTLGDKKATKQTIQSLSDDFVAISKSFSNNPVHADFTNATVKNATASFKDTVGHLLSYADDVVVKAGKQDVSKVKEFIQNISNRKIIGRLATNLSMYLAVIAVLQTIPKLYNAAEGKGNSGLKGLMKEETLNDKPAEIKTTETAKKQEVKDKSNPSFGSASSVVSKLTGNGTVGKIARAVEFEGCNVSFPLLLGIMGLGILIPRTLQAKDKYDREEILRRDLVTCATMCFAEKELRKAFSKYNEAKFGLVLAAKDEAFNNKSKFQKFFDYLRPIKGVQVLSSEQIVSKYSGISKYKNGIKDFCDFVDGQGGNLGKVFSVTDEAKALVSGLLQKESLDIGTATNSQIKEALSKLENATEVKKLVEMFDKPNNAWVTKAKTLNARFTALSVLVLVPVFLGFLLPWFNAKTTKKKVAEENAVKEAAAQALKNKQSQVDTSFFKTSAVFNDITTFSK